MAVQTPGRKGLLGQMSYLTHRGWSKRADFSIKIAVLLAPFGILLFASFSSFARRKRRRGWAAAQISIKSVFGHSQNIRPLAIRALVW
jgi:hypothetical protein